MIIIICSLVVGTWMACVLHLLCKVIGELRLVADALEKAEKVRFVRRSWEDLEKREQAGEKVVWNTLPSRA